MPGKRLKVDVEVEEMQRSLDKRHAAWKADHGNSYPCPWCFYTYNQPHQLRAHIKRCHLVE